MSLRWIVGVALALLLGAGWTGAALLDDGGVPHDVPVLLVGPDVVTRALVDESAARDDQSLVLGSTDDAAAATSALAAGEVVATVAIDLRDTEDILTLGPFGSARLDDAVVDLVSDLEATRGRTVHVDRGPDPAVAALTVALVAAMLGFALAVTISALRGPVATTVRGALARIAAVAALAAAVGALVGLVERIGDGPPGASRAVALAGAAAAAGLVTFACEALAGLRGIVVAALLTLAAPLPLLIAGDRLLLDQPWRSVTDWTIIGAAGAEGGDRVLTWLVVLGAIVLSLVLLRARRAAVGPAVEEPTPPPVRRQLVALATASAALATVAYYGWSSTLDRSPAVAGASLASTTSCVPTGPVTSVADLNAISHLRGSARMRGGDIGASAALQDGRSVWLFGDTLRDADIRGGQFVRNSMVVAGPDCLQVLVPESGGAVIPDRSDGAGYWPMSIAVAAHPGYDLLTVMSQRVRTVDETDVFGFEILGPAAVSFVVPKGGVPQYLSTVDLGADAVDTTRPMWGAATVLTDGWLYLYGTARPEDAEPGTGFSLRVARVRPDLVTRPGRWTYWDGDAWVADAGAAVELLGARDGVSQTLSVLHVGDRWIAFSKRGELFGQNLVFWTAADPTGPFTAEPPVAALPSDATTGTLRYLPLAHPELLPRRRSVVVSYSENLLDSSAVFADPMNYRIHFLRVPLPAR